MARQITEPEDLKLKVDNSLQKYGIQVLGVEHSEFENELQKYLVENGRDAVAISEVQASAILIRNTSEREIVGVALCWTMAAPDGPVVPQSRSHPGVLMGMKPLDPAMVGKTSLINVGASQFFSYSGVGSGVQAGVTTFGTGQPVRHSPVSVIVDGVFFDDGSFVGENKSFYFEQISGSVKANLDFVTRINEGLRAGKSHSEIIAEFLAETPTSFAVPHRGSARQSNSDQEAFELSYAGSMISFGKEISRFRNMGRNDEAILDIYKRQKVKDFKTLRKLAG